MAENGNHWGEMGAAEWRGKLGEKVERIEILVASVCAKVDAHDKTLAVLDDRASRAQLGGRARAIITASVITSMASIIVALIALIGG